MKEPTVLHVPAGVGIDQSTRAEHVQPGGANLYAQNVRATRKGSLTKRQGFTLISSARFGSGTRTAGARVAAYKDSIVVSDGTVLDVYSPTADRWSSRGRLSECDARRFKVASAGLDAALDTANMIDIAYGAGFYVLVSKERMDAIGNYAIIAHVIDAATHQVVYAKNISGLDNSAAGSDARVVIVGNNVVILASAAAYIFGYRMSLLNISAGFSAPVAVVSAAYNQTTFDVHALTSRIAIAYENTGLGTTRITLKTIDPTVDALTAFQTQNETTANAAISGLAITGEETEELWLAWGNVSTLNVFVSARNPTTLSSVIIAGASAFTVDTNGPRLIGIGRTAAREAYVIAATLDAKVSTWFTSGSVRIRNVASVLTVDRPMPMINGWVPVSKPFAMGGRALVEMAYDDTGAGIYNVALVDITADASTASFNRNQTARPVAWAAPRANVYWSGGNGQGGCARHVAVRSATVSASVHLMRASGATTGLCITEYDFGTRLNQQALAYADSLYFTGGLLYQFDGQRVYEAGFIVPPRVTTGSTGTGITGTYLYTAIYEFTDALGNVTWSAPAPVQTIVVANKTVWVWVRLPSVTWKEGYDGNTDLEPQGLRKTKTKIYRTADGGGDFYLLATVIDNPLNGVYRYDDTTVDATLITRAKLYKTPGRVGAAQDRNMPGAVRHMVECNGVPVMIGDDGATLRCFAGRVVGESPWHADRLQLPIEGDGEVVALASLDGTCVVFKRSEIYLIPVEPSNANVSAGGFGSPRRIAVDAGCVEPRSVVVTSLGVFFQSDRGIELLTRSLTVEPIGAKIQDTFALYPNVMAAVLDVRNGIVRFSLAQTGSSTVGLDAIFDLNIHEWVGFDVKTGSAALAQSVSAAYALYLGAWRYVWLDAAGAVRYESFSSYLDNHPSAGFVWVTMQWETPWLKTELQREHQFWQGDLLYERKTACGLLAEIGWDWTAYAVGDNKVWTEALITAYPRQAELRVSRRGQTFRCRFSDSAPAVVGSGQGLELIGLSVDLAPVQGPTQGTPRVAVGARK